MFCVCEIIRADNVKLFGLTTDEFAKIWTEPIDFLFIDACHERSQVLTDFMNFSKLVREGTGIIAMHDTHPICKELLAKDRCHTTWEAAMQIRKLLHEEFEIFTIPGPFAGLSLLRKINKNKHLSWE